MKNIPVLAHIPYGWSLQPVSDVFTFVKSYAFSRDNLVNGTVNDEGIGNIHYGDIHSTFTSPSIDLSQVSIPTIKDRSFAPKKEDLLKDGDLIMADASEDYAGVGVTVSVHGLKDRKVVGGLHTFVLRDVEGKTDEYYRQYIFRNLKIRNSLQKIANGVSVYGISKTALSKILLPLPPLSEQRRIVSILETWDKATDALIKKNEDRKRLKIVLVNKCVFQRKDAKLHIIEDIFDLGRGRVVSRGDIAAHQGIYPVYSSQTSEDGVFGRIDTYDFEGDYLTWTTDGANAGRVFYRRGKFNCTNVCGTAKPKENSKVNLYFVATYLNRITRNYVSYVGNPKLMNGVFGSISVMLPSFEEQNKAADILQVADAEISILEKKLANFQFQRIYLLNALMVGVIRTSEVGSITTKQTKI